MGYLGIFLIILGAGSFVLPKINIDFIVTDWLNNTIPDYAVPIRIGLAVIGVILLVIANWPRDIHKIKE